MSICYYNYEFNFSPSYFTEKADQERELEKFPFKENISSLQAEVQSNQLTYEELWNRAHSDEYNTAPLIQFFVQLSKNPEEDAIQLLSTADTYREVYQVVKGLACAPEANVERIEGLLQQLLGKKRPTVARNERCSSEAQKFLEDALEKLACEKAFGLWQNISALVR